MSAKSERVRSLWPAVYLKGVYWTRSFQYIHERSFLSTTEMQLSELVDDTKLIISFELKDNLDAITDLKDDLSKIGEWWSNHLLLLNPSKIKLMIFGSRQMHSKLEIPFLPFMGRDLIPADTTRDLGATLDSNLTYDEHI